MIYRKMIIGLMLIAYSSMIFCGCGKETPEEVISVVENTVNEIIEDIDEEITVSENGINCIVDNRGYTNDEEKKVFFKDIDEGTQFWIVEKESFRAVYEGNVTELMDSEFDGVGDFSDVTVSGNYYVYTMNNGESPEFVINDSINKDTARTIYPEFFDMTDISETNCKALMFGLMSYDLNRDEENLLVNIAVPLDEYLKLDEIDDNQAVMLGTVFAQFYCMGQKKYNDLAKKSLVAAKKIYKACTGNEKIEGSPEWYAFNTWMLRATGDSDYSDVIEDYLDNNEREDSAIRFIGDYGYLTATKNVKASNGYKLITPIMDEAAITVSDTRSASDLRIIDVNNIEQSLLDISKLTYVNYVITNQEYRKAIRNNLHYLFGRNINNVDYIDNADSCLQGDEGLYYKSMILFILSNVDFVLETGEDLP